MAKKPNLATALHKAPGKRNKNESAPGATEASGGTMMTVTAETIAGADSAAPQTPIKAIPSVGRLLSRAVYQTLYCASYGIVFTAVMITRWIPTDNAMVRGIQDGAAAAKESFQQWQAHAMTAQAQNDPDSAIVDQYPATA